MSVYIERQLLIRGTLKFNCLMLALDICWIEINLKNMRNYHEDHYWIYFIGLSCLLISFTYLWHNECKCYIVWIFKPSTQMHLLNKSRHTCSTVACLVRISTCTRSKILEQVVTARLWLEKYIMRQKGV